MKRAAILASWLVVAFCAITSPLCQGKRYMCPAVESTDQSMTCVTIIDPLLKVHQVQACPQGY